MICICPNCKNPEWNKEVSGDKKRIKCPVCGFEWKSTGLPLYILTGCSGVGKTTTAMELLQRQNKKFIVLDADYFVFMKSESQEDWYQHLERMEEISADMMQNGLPVVWTMAGCVDRLYEPYNSRFFREIKCLALTCEEQELRRRMTVGRNITDEGWIQSSVDYNRYFMEHDKIGEVPYIKLDITGKTTEEIADLVTVWIEQS